MFQGAVIILLGLIRLLSKKFESSTVPVRVWSNILSFSFKNKQIVNCNGTYVLRLKTS